MSEFDYYLLFSVSPIGPIRFKKAIQLFSTAQIFWDELMDFIKREEKKKSFVIKGYDFKIGPQISKNIINFLNTFNLASYKERLLQNNIHFIPSNGSSYPQLLHKLENPPIGLFVKGDTACLNSPTSLAVVGTRKITSYGRIVTEKLVSEIASYTITIVSGLALGVDTVAHKTALANNTKTIAVLGCGVDCCYPRENKGLYKQIIENGGLIVSEYPLSAPAAIGTFPARNRIIACLSNGILVPEAGEDSGSLITTRVGKELGLPLFAVPGPITSLQSQGTSFLLKDGAKLVTSGKDIISELHIASSELSFKQTITIENLDLSPVEKKIVTLLLDEPYTIDDLSRQTKELPSTLSKILSGLELQGIIKNGGAGKFEVCL